MSEHTSSDPQHTQRLISRIADGEASPQQWRAFVAEADTTPHLWRELAITQREAGQVTSALSWTQTR